MLLILCVCVCVDLESCDITKITLVIGVLFWISYIDNMLAVNRSGDWGYFYLVTDFIEKTFSFTIEKWCLL